MDRPVRPFNRTLDLLIYLGNRPQEKYKRFIVINDDDEIHFLGNRWHGLAIWRWGYSKEIHLYQYGLHAKGYLCIET